MEKLRRPAGRRPRGGDGASAELRRSSEQLRKLAARLQVIREDERASLARELHDHLGQVLVAMKVDLTWLRRHLPQTAGERGPKDPAEKVGELTALVDDAIGIVRRVAVGLRPPALDDMGLWPAIEAEAKRFADRTGIRCQVHSCGGHDERGDPASAIVHFRIVQEALANVAMHARATAVDICRCESEGRHVLCVADDGRGIRDAEIASASALGLLGMRERALSVGGDLTVTGAPGQGTTVKVSMASRPRSRRK